MWCLISVCTSGEPVSIDGHVAESRVILVTLLAVGLMYTLAVQFLVPIIIRVPYALTRLAAVVGTNEACSLETCASFPVIRWTFETPFEKTPSCIEPCRSGPLAEAVASSQHFRNET